MTRQGDYLHQPRYLDGATLIEVAYAPLGAAPVLVDVLPDSADIAAGIEAANMSSAQRDVRDRRREWTAAWAADHDVAFTRAEFQAANGLDKAAADFALRDAESAGLLMVVHRGRHGDRYGTPTMWCAA